VTHNPDLVTIVIIKQKIDGERDKFILSTAATLLLITLFLYMMLVEMLGAVRAQRLSASEKCSLFFYNCYE
jgi:hypothetical protein